MFTQLTKVLVGGLFALALSTPAAAWANATIQSSRGEVQVGTSMQTLIPARENQRLAPGTTVVTGADSQVVLNFEDGQRVVLHQNTQFRIVDFQYNTARPEADRAIFDILRGALRIVTGAIGQRNRSAFSLRSPQATIGVRGTDFMVSIINPLYISVTQGAVAASNAAGTVAFSAGTIGTVATGSALATTISASALPAAASSAFTALGSVQISAAGALTTAGSGTATGAGAATGSAAGTALGTAGIVGAAVVGVAAASGSDDATTQHTTTTHH